MAIRTEPKLRKADRIVGQSLAALNKAYEPMILPAGVKWPPKPGDINMCDPAALTVMRPGRPHSGKRVVSIRLDPEVLKKFQATGRGWQQRMNDILKAAKV